MNEQTIYNKTRPFLAKVKERYDLCKKGSSKSTFHLVLDLEGSGMSYHVGDSIAILPENDPEDVKKLFDLLKVKEDALIAEKMTKAPITIGEFFLKKANLTEIPKKLLQYLALKQENRLKKEHLEFLLKEEQKETLKEYQKTRQILDVINENQEVVFCPEEFSHFLQPLLPRFYSIASSMKVVGNEIHLLIALLNYETNGYQRIGVCTDYLCHRVPLGVPAVPVYIQPSHGFTLPQDPFASMIMIGPGTGVAPYRAFMQERMMHHQTGLNWLFFGERNRSTEFFYEEEWVAHVQQEKLRLDVAFSRDQEQKVYVQHKLLENGREVFDLLEKGAYLFVCGDAKKMAKDVDQALHHIIKTHGNFEENQTKEYIKKLRNEKRYVRDVY